MNKTHSQSLLCKLTEIKKSAIDLRADQDRCPEDIIYAGIDPGSFFKNLNLKLIGEQILGILQQTGGKPPMFHGAVLRFIDHTTEEFSNIGRQELEILKETDHAYSSGAVQATNSSLTPVLFRRIPNEAMLAKSGFEVQITPGLGDHKTNKMTKRGCVVSMTDPSQRGLYYELYSQNLAGNVIITPECKKKVGSLNPKLTGSSGFDRFLYLRKK